MNKLILHHYPNSPFAEKIRLILGFKKLQWDSVMIPNMMPKPDVIALTGGYRKTPVLQIGADVYCDTALIADVIELLAPTPSLYPPEIAAASRILAQWADSTLFWTSVPYAMQPAGLAHMFAGVPPETIKAWGEDRAVFRANTPRMRPAEANAAFAIYLRRLDESLGGKSFFFGDSPSIADFSIYHCLWFVSRGGPVAQVLDSSPRIQAWRDRMAAFGHGTFDRLDSSEAIRIANAASPDATAGVSVDPHGIAAGEGVVIAATDTGVDPVEGALYGTTEDRLSIKREDARAGTVVVHFPRLGFEMRRVK
jgi:glutathione S-transferase